LLLVSTIGALLQPRLAERRAKSGAQPPVSIALPVMMIEDCFERAEESAFTQDYPQFEVVAAAIDTESAPSRVMREIFARHPEVPSRLLQSSGRLAASPKVDNLVAPFTQARFDSILMKDSNATLEPGDLAEHMRQLSPDVGLVCAIPYAANPKNLAAQVEAAIMNGPDARMLFLASCLGQGHGVGKIMLFRRSDFLRAGGFEAISHTVGEDNAMAKAMKRIGLRTVFSHRPVRQELERRLFEDVYQRQLRWSVIRRGEAPLSFLLEPIRQAFPSLIAAAGAAPLVGLAPGTAAAATFLLWLAVETMLSFAKGWRVVWRAPAILFLREALMLAVWLRAWTTSQVVWAKARFEARTEAPTLRAARKEG
jgi:ceramide glucosyltransferase